MANVESLVVGPGIKTGLDIRLDNPGAVGSDIVCMCVALKEQYPCPVIVIGMGTATTILYMNEHKAYCGGVILPGVQISLDALTANAHFCRRSVFLRRKRQSEQILPTVYAAA